MVTNVSLPEANITWSQKISLPFRRECFTTQGGPTSLPPVPAPVSCQLPSPGSAVVLAEDFFLKKLRFQDGPFGENISLPSGNLQHSYWKSPFFMGKSTINGDLVMLVYQRVYIQIFGLFGLFLSFDSLRFSGWNSMEMLLIVKWDEQLTLRMWTTNMTRHMHIWVWINTY